MKNSPIFALEDIRIAKPCRADWNAMTGDDRARFCGSCHKNVYDLSRMSRPEAEDLIRQHEGDVCLRLHRRADGTVITSDCPVGMRAARRPFFALAAGFAALLASGLAVAAHTPVGTVSVGQETIGQRLFVTPILNVLERINPLRRQATMGSPMPPPGFVMPTGTPPAVKPAKSVGPKESRSR